MQPASTVASAGPTSNEITTAGKKDASNKRVANPSTGIVSPTKEVAPSSDGTASTSKQASSSSEQAPSSGERPTSSSKKPPYTEDGESGAKLESNHGPHQMDILPEALSSKQPEALKRAREEDGDGDDSNNMAQDLSNRRVSPGRIDGSTTPESSTAARSTQGKGDREETHQKLRRRFNAFGMNREVQKLPPEKRQKVLQWRDSSMFGVDMDRRHPMVEKQWQSLDSDINIFARDALASTFPWDTMTKEDREWVTSWSLPDTPQFTELDDCGQPCSSELWAAFIWHFLWDELWSPDCPLDKWKEGPWRLYAETQAATIAIADQEDVDEEVGQWYRAGRFVNGRILYSLHGWHTDPDRLVARLKERVQPYLSPPLKDEFNQGILAEVVESIGLLAVEADFLLQTSIYDVRLDFHLPDMDGSPVYGSPFQADCAYMQRVHDRDREYDMKWDGSPILFATRPLLRVFGKFLNHMNGIVDLMSRGGEILGHKGTFDNNLILWPVAHFDKTSLMVPMVVVVDPTNSAVETTGLQAGYGRRRAVKTARPEVANSEAAAQGG
jgi:hypothetical protein